MELTLPELREAKGTRKRADVLTSDADEARARVAAGIDMIVIAKPHTKNLWEAAPNAFLISGPERRLYFMVKGMYHRAGRAPFDSPCARTGECRSRIGFELRQRIPLIVVTAFLVFQTSPCAPQSAAEPSQEPVTSKIAAEVFRLIEACANPVVLATWDNTPLHWAVCNQDPAALGPLIQAGSDLWQTNMSGLTPLQLAAYVDPNPAVIRTLLDAGADVNAPNHRGETPLHLAARHNGNPAVLAILLEAGAEIDAVTNDGKTAWDLARENRRLKGDDVLQSTAP